MQEDVVIIDGTLDLTVRQPCCHVRRIEGWSGGNLHRCVRTSPPAHLATAPAKVPPPRVFYISHICLTATIPVDPGGLPCLANNLDYLQCQYSLAPVPVLPGTSAAVLPAMDRKAILAEQRCMHASGVPMECCFGLSCHLDDIPHGSFIDN